MTGAFASAYSQDSQNNTDFSYAISNAIRKYGSAYRTLQANLVSQRLASWVFAGSGKWGAIQPDLAANPVLAHSAVPNVVPGGHPDAWDPNILKQLTATLDVADRLERHESLHHRLDRGERNRRSHGGVGSHRHSCTGCERAGQAGAGESSFVRHLFGKRERARRGLEDHATTVAAVYASNPIRRPRISKRCASSTKAPGIPSLYKRCGRSIPTTSTWEAGLYREPTPPNGRSSRANCDVIGFDYYNQTFLDPGVQALHSKHEEAGAWWGNFPSPDYGGMRGFGSLDKDITYTDAQSGQMYAEWLQNASRKSLRGRRRVVPICRSARNWKRQQRRRSRPRALVIGQNQAFGMLDVTHQPKYDLVNAVRAANIATLQSLGLLGTAPMLTSAPAEWRDLS